MGQIKRQRIENRSERWWYGWDIEHSLCKLSPPLRIKMACSRAIFGCNHSDQNAVRRWSTKRWCGMKRTSHARRRHTPSGEIGSRAIPPLACLRSYGSLLCCGCEFLQHTRASAQVDRQAQARRASSRVGVVHESLPSSNIFSWQTQKEIFSTALPVAGTAFTP